MGDSVAPNLHALLIGVCGYLPTKEENGILYPALGGCVGDVQRMEDFLQHYLGVPKERIAKLTASGDGSAPPPEPPELRPTYENMVAAFRRLGEQAAPGDQVYIHYSGHGGRTDTFYPDLKGRGGLDESLVPFDIGTPGGAYLRDVEIGFLLEELLDRGLLVTVVLDSCHSGSATRGRAWPRGVPEVDHAARPERNDVASHPALAASWRGRGRSVAGPGRWLGFGVAGAAERAGLVVLAACRPQESALEDDFPGEGMKGVLTHWLLDTLRQSGAQLTFAQLHARLQAKIGAVFPNQTPMLLGDPGRVVFEFARRSPLPSVRVVAVDGDEVVLTTGEIEGVAAGAQFAVYRDEAETDRREAWIARVTIERSGLELVNSRAKIEERRPLVSPAPIEEGAPAILLDPGAVELKSGICLLPRDALPGAVRQGPALAAVRDAVAATRGFVCPSEEIGKIDFYVAVDADGRFEILDPSRQPIPHLRPALSIDDPTAAARVVQRLVHLTKFRNIAEIDVVERSTEPSIGVTAKLLGVQRDFVYGDVPKPKPFAVPGNLAELEEGEWTFLQVENLSSREVDVTILNLQPDWGITQLYPASDGAFLWPLAEKRAFAEPFALQAHLPEGYEEATDILKIYATPRATNLQWLQLPPLDRPPLPKPAYRTGSALERLFAALATDAPATRTYRQGEVGSLEWATAQVQIRVRRRGAKV